MLVECKCGWAGDSKSLALGKMCPKCGRYLTIKYTDEWNDHYPEHEEEDDDE